MNREFLKGLGLDDAAIDKVMAEHGKTVNTAKETLTTAQTERDTLKTQLAERDKDLTDLKGKAKGSEELQTQLTTLQTKYDSETADFASKLKETQLNSAIKLALAGKVHDTDYAITLIDKEKVKFDKDGNVTEGLDEQVTTLQTSKSFLFVEKQEEKPPAFKGTKPGESDPPGTAPASIGAGFAQQANKQSEPVKNTIWN